MYKRLIVSNDKYPPWIVLQSLRALLLSLPETKKTNPDSEVQKILSSIVLLFLDEVMKIKDQSVISSDLLCDGIINISYLPSSMKLTKMEVIDELANFLIYEKFEGKFEKSFMKGGIKPSSALQILMALNEENLPIAAASLERCLRNEFLNLPDKAAGFEEKELFLEGLIDGLASLNRQEIDALSEVKGVIFGGDRAHRAMISLLKASKGDLQGILKVLEFAHRQRDVNWEDFDEEVQIMLVDLPEGSFKNFEDVSKVMNFAYRNSEKSINRFRKMFSMRPDVEEVIDSSFDQKAGQKDEKILNKFAILSEFQQSRKTIPDSEMLIPIRVKNKKY
eukprot:GDKJ01003685.1.p1 GENE.GDKJ01003685.1~~GDKJ01003685.1.p1  ORF type:complete len:359 (-),score=113.54 GDKJ01003685.1:41-1045(-)